MVRLSEKIAIQRVAPDYIRDILSANKSWGPGISRGEVTVDKVLHAIERTPGRFGKNFDTRKRG